MFDSESLARYLMKIAVNDSSAPGQNKRNKAYSDVQMTTVERESESWALLVYRENFYLDIRCEMWPYRLHLLMKLINSEADAYAFAGKRYIESLIAQIRPMPALFYRRNESIEMQHLVQYAIACPIGRKDTVRIK